MYEVWNYINGHRQPAEQGKTAAICNPATGIDIGTVSLSDATDCQLAVSAAQKAFPRWSQLSAKQRYNHLNQLADALLRHSETLALLESQDTGKPLALAQTMDIPRAVSNIRYFAGAILHTYSKAHDMAPNGYNITRMEPLGVVGVISPWNLPLYLLTWKIAPALAAGNCVIAKPSEMTPLTADFLGKILSEIDFPKGVLNICHGKGHEIGKAICEHPDISAISFTGSTHTGRQIAQSCAPSFKKLSLEMGGKNPTIIFADCDFDKAVQGAVRAAFTNQGQVCLCGSRILIEKSCYEAFKQAFLDETRQLRVGPPNEPTTDLGALISKAHFEKVLSYIQLAQQEGGSILLGGDPIRLPAPFDKGFFMAPTVIEGLSHTTRVNQEEIFGPVVTLQSFETEQEALALANNTRYGLSASIWSNHFNRIQYFVNQLQVGMVWVNDWLKRDLRVPFGGYKQSGLGREGGEEALRFFTQSKNIYFDYAGEQHVQ